MQLLQLVVEPQGELRVGCPLASWHLMLLGRLDAHLDQLLERLGQANSAEEAGLKCASAQENVLAENLEVVVLLNVRAGLLLLVAQSSTGVKVAVLVGVALDAPGQSLVQLALHIHMLGTLVLQSSLRGGSEAIHLHLAHFQRLRLHFVQSKNVLHNIESVL